MIDTNKIRILGNRVLLEMCPPEVSSLIELPQGLPSSTFKVLKIGPDASIACLGSVVLVDYRNGFFLDSDAPKPGDRIIVKESDILLFRTLYNLPPYGPFAPADGYILGQFVEDRSDRDLIIRPDKIEVPEKVNDVVKFRSDDGYVCWVRRGEMWDIRCVTPEGLYQGHLVLKSDVLLEEVLSE